jgi:hypothetical protein
MFGVVPLCLRSIPGKLGVGQLPQLAINDCRNTNRDPLFAGTGNTTATIAGAQILEAALPARPAGVGRL